MPGLRLLFGSVVFLAAFLLFLVEPMVAKQLLPVLGGSAAVWITCLVFFQCALLVGYLYAHWLSRTSQRLGFMLLLALGAASAIVWAIRPLITISGSAHPVSTIFVALSLSIGLPFLLLAATSPLMQVWWARLETGGIPYRLYALSNLASLMALGLYPTWIEPHLALRNQRFVWCAGFLLFALLSALVAQKAHLPPLESEQPFAVEPNPVLIPRFTKALWFLLPMGGAMQLSAITSHLIANIAAIPLLWILPLAVYLITLILAFQFPRLGQHVVVGRFLIVMLAGLAYMLTQTEATLPMRIAILFFLAELFFACLFLHAGAVALRPTQSSEATLFYLLFAAGGALGSFLVGIVFPLLFRFDFDLAITFLVTAILALASTWSAGWNQRLIWVSSSVMLAVLVIWLNIASRRETLTAVRNFYASLRVKQDFSYPGATVRTLSNGSIQHGTQIFATYELRHTPTTYYARDSGVGLALRFCCGGRSRNIGVIGLGAGTLAAYGQPGDRFRFYEINPAVEPVARNDFTYIRESGARVEVVEGDGRAELSREDPQQFDVLVVDAFSGDAIPLHLLTTQALTLYRRHLARGGIVAFHISNQHVDLAPPIVLLAASAGMQTRSVTSLADDARGEFSATWVLVTDNTSFFTQPEVAAHSVVPEPKPGLRVWTDDYSALLPVLRW